MKNVTLTLVHVLAVDPPQGGTVKTRSTVRTGSPAIGDCLSFEGADGKAQVLTVVSIEHSPRWSTIVFTGTPEALAGVATGTYLRATSAVAQAPAPRPWWPTSRDSRTTWADQA
jgi:hypothetical protein